MPYRCVTCEQSYAMLWEVKKHFIKHVPAPQRALTCPIPECGWFGHYDRDYQVHRKTNKHLALVWEKDLSSKEEGQAIPNPRARKTLPDTVGQWYDIDDTDEERIKVSGISKQNGHQTTKGTSDGSKKDGHGRSEKEKVRNKVKLTNITLKKPAATDTSPEEQVQVVDAEIQELMSLPLLRDDSMKELVDSVLDPTPPGSCWD